MKQNLWKSLIGKLNSRQFVVCALWHVLAESHICSPSDSPKSNDEPVKDQFGKLLSLVIHCNLICSNLWRYLNDQSLLFRCCRRREVVFVERQPRSTSFESFYSDSCDVCTQLVKLLPRGIKEAMNVLHRRQFIETF